MSHLNTSTAEKLKELDTFLASHDYISGDHPGHDDARVFATLSGYPDKALYPNVFYWFQWLSCFQPSLQASWKPKDEKAKKEHKKSEHKDEPKKEAKKEEAKKADDDLFGSDNEEDKKKEAELKAKVTAAQAANQAAGKKEKKAVIAKSIVIFDVKVYEAEDEALLLRIAQRIKDEIKLDGLVWGQEVKIEAVAFGAKKLKMNCIIEDAKVLTDDIFDKILAWEDDVQSVDVVQMQKL